jgi:hypothetical protein
MGQDSRPIHMSHLICSKLILVPKVKQNNSRFSFALPYANTTIGGRLM